MSVESNGRYGVSFSQLPPKIFEKILSWVPVESKVRARRVCKEWSRLIRPLLTFRIPDLNDVTIKIIANSSEEIPELRVTWFLLSVPMTLSFVNGHKVKSIRFEDTDISEDNMVWLLTKCYSLKEVIIEQKKSSGGKFGNFLRSNARIINMASRTLKSFQIIGPPTTTETVKEEKINWTFDCGILRDCTSLQSFIILRLPLLKLKNIQDLPQSLAHLALEEEEEGFSKFTNGDSESLGNSPSSPHSRLRSFGFIDFSSPVPVPVKTFQYVIRLTRLRRLGSTPLNGQELLEACRSQGVRTFSAVWNSDMNQYQIKREFTTNQSL